MEFTQSKMNTLKTLLAIQKQVNALVAELSTALIPDATPTKPAAGGAAAAPDAPKRGRGRPRKIKPEDIETAATAVAKAIEEAGPPPAPEAETDGETFAGWLGAADAVAATETVVPLVEAPAPAPAKKIIRKKAPVEVTEDPDAKIYKYLFTLQESGDTNMLNCAPYLIKKFGMTKVDADRHADNYVDNYDALYEKYGTPVV